MSHMSDQEISKFKEPIWMLSPKGGQMKRILRPAEAFELLRNIDTDDQGLFRKMDISSYDVQLWLQCLLLTGMRLSELLILKKDPTDNEGNSLFRPNGTIWLPKDKFGDVGKLKILTKQRFVILSDAGRKAVEKFLTEASMPVLTTDEKLTPRVVSDVFDKMLKASADRIGLQKITTTRTQMKAVKNERGIPEVDEKGNILRERVNVPLTTSGVMVRSFRATWESWLMQSFGKDTITVREIMKSIGHNFETAMSHYVGTEFDSEDLRDIKKYTAGFGTLTEKVGEEVKE